MSTMTVEVTERTRRSSSTSSTIHPRTQRAAAVLDRHYRPPPPQQQHPRSGLSDRPCLHTRTRRAPPVGSHPATMLAVAAATARDTRQAAACPPRARASSPGTRSVQLERLSGRSEITEVGWVWLATASSSSCSSLRCWLPSSASGDSTDPTASCLTRSTLEVR